MLTNETEIRVRYGETDKMGVVYYGTYSLYYEVGRTDLMRKYGISYGEMEKKGIQMPVIHMECSYYKPAFYDDLIYIKTTVKKFPDFKIIFEYEIFNSKKILLNKASTTLIFLDSQSGKPKRAPLFFLEQIKNYFQA